MTGYTKETLGKAQSLRSDMTDAERKLWSALRNRQLAGAKFRKQQPIGPFIVDFACHEHRLIIEADGGQHAENIGDAQRTAFLQTKGYRVLRFWNTDILTNLNGVAQVIATELSIPHPARASRESPSPSRGEGSAGVPHA